MKKRRVADNVLWITLLLAGSFWFGAALFQYLWFNLSDMPFFLILVAIDDPHELVIRMFFTTAVFMGGVTVARVLVVLVQAESVAREQEENLRITLNSIGDAVIATDTEGFITRMNPVAEQLTGWKYADVQGFPLSDVFNVVNILTTDMVFYPGGRVLENDEIERLANKTILVSRDGTEYQISKSGKPICDATGTVSGMVVVFRDVTAEHQLREKLRELASIVEQAAEGIAVADLEGNLLFVNFAWALMHGYASADELQGENLRAFHTTEQMREEVMPAVEQVKQGVHYIGEIRHMHQDGSLFSTQMSVNLLRYEDGSPYALAGFAQDLTERKRMEEMMIQSEKMLSVGGLAAGMAHEINNPLGGMIQTALVMSNRLSEDIPANLKAAAAAGTSMEAIRAFMAARGIPRMLNAIQSSGQRVAAIVDNMLSFARRGTEQTSTYDVVELLDRTLGLAATDYDLKRKYDFKTIKIVRDYQEGLPPVLCEGAKIQQVFLNVLRNGAEAMQESDSSNSLFVLRSWYEKERAMVCVSISDNGPGMEEAVRKRVFEPFFTTKPVGFGTGLGLSVSYFIVTENHGGEMLVLSTPGRGATFIIRLPVS